MAPLDAEYLIIFDVEKCIQCHGCEIACKSWRDLSFGIQYRRVLNRWREPYPGSSCFSLSLACLHCVDPQCAAACPEDAIMKQSDNGVVAVDGDLCTGCQMCLDACPFDVPQFNPDGKMEKCDLCLHQGISVSTPPCIDTCPGQALYFRPVSKENKVIHEEAIKKHLKTL
jgi:Fe-S-cluster-containing dehydrogenase component